MLVMRAVATIDRYAHAVTAGKGMAGRRLKVNDRRGGASRTRTCLTCPSMWAWPVCRYLS